MRRVALRACEMAAGQRGAVISVTALAVDIGGTRDLVHAMAIEAAVHTGVLGLFLCMTIGAGPRNERRRLMRVMAARARFVAMCADLVDWTLWRGVTPHAARRRDRRVAAEVVAVLTPRRMNAGVKRRGLRVTRRADLERWERKTGVSVTCRARDLTDVRDVARARGDLVVRRGHLGGRTLVSASAAECDHRERDRRTHHGREPIGWHNLHGIAEAGSLLDHPAGCGLPPTPPTLWQPMHKL
jgi:hypothetical protein